MVVRISYLLRSVFSQSVETVAGNFYVIMEFIPNNRGGKKLYFEGCMYTRKALKTTVIQWECNIQH